MNPDRTAKDQDNFTKWLVACLKAYALYIVVCLVVGGSLLATLLYVVAHFVVKNW